MGRTFLWEGLSQGVSLGIELFASMLGQQVGFGIGFQPCPKYLVVKYHQMSTVN